ncbi:hypothetical protein PVK06_044167 [Gossypium arboreum]|uniref:Uncharacterized protein n=1 Tax=Gossypium arboreum TaxID=29729 RepID=A0ABR0MQY2_GOSAR|nr:hypothetical protein PVK06_044167 [Gossypium arboreum]
MGITVVQSKVLYGPGVFPHRNRTRCVLLTQEIELRRKPKNHTVDVTRACAWPCAKHGNVVDKGMAIRKTQSCGGVSMALWATRARPS